MVALAALFILGAKEAGSSDEARLALPIAKVDGKPITIKYMETITEKQNPALIKELSDKEKEAIEIILSLSRGTKIRVGQRNPPRESLSNLTYYFGRIDCILWLYSKGLVEPTKYANEKTGSGQWEVK